MNFIKFLLSKAFLKHILLAVMAIVVIVFVVLKWLNITTNHGEFKEVPDLTGKSIKVVEALLEEQTLRLKIQDCTNYNPDFPKFSVLEQNPEKGTKVKEDRKIYVTLNPSGYKKIKLPDVVGKTKRQAVATLKALDFQIGKVYQKPGFAKDVVMELEYKGKKITTEDLLSRTSVIDIVVSDGSLDFGESAPVESEEKPSEENGESGDQE
ncbi:MAG: PASTA domain-containing protein [Flavobacteriaceae bacterium]|nr:PASTA domain-containing protein [Flavobacteriaceae bacterium]